jgi:hypothetical protein
MYICYDIQLNVLYLCNIGSEYFHLEECDFLMRNTISRFNIKKITISCTVNSLSIRLHYKKYAEKNGYNDLLLKINRIFECKHNPNTTSLLPFKNNDVYKNILNFFIMSLKNL